MNHRRHYVAKLDKSGALPPVVNGNIPYETWPMIILSEIVAGPSGSENREVHLVIDNETDLDALEYAVKAQRERLRLYGDTGRVLPDGSRT